MAEVGCYVVHLYCDVGQCKNFSEFTGQTEGRTLAEARKRGWSHNPKGRPRDAAMGNGRSVCPICQAQKRYRDGAGVP